MPVILFVDDNMDILALGKIHLERSGIFTVDTTTSAVSAIEGKNLTKYDAILSDYHMPVMNGIEFLQYIRKNIGNVPVLIITTDESEDLSISAFEKGADACLKKTTVKDMFHMLESLLIRAIELRQTPGQQLLNQHLPLKEIGRFPFTDPGALILIHPLPGGYLCRDTNCGPFYYIQNHPKKNDQSILPRLLNGHARNLMRTQTVHREFRERSIIKRGGPSDHART